MVAAKKTSRADRQINRALYAPKAAVKPKPKPAKEAPDMVALRKLTSKVLDSLKNPSAIPSQVILAALVQAKAM